MILKKIKNKKNRKNSQKKRENKGVKDLALEHKFGKK